MSENGKLGEIRDLLGQIRGVLAVDIVPLPGGNDGIGGIDIQVENSESARQVTRDVESALLSGLGLTIDHRDIHIIYEGNGAGGNGRPAAPRDPREDEETSFTFFPAQSLQNPGGMGRSRFGPHNRRIRLVAVRSTPDGTHYVEVAVELESAGKSYVGHWRDADTGRGRLLAAGKATLEAFNRTLAEDIPIALEGIDEFSVCDDRALMCVLSARIGRERPVFHGSALLGADPLESAARAVLDALNRFAALQEQAAV